MSELLRVAAVGTEQVIITALDLQVILNCSIDHLAFMVDSAIKERAVERGEIDPDDGFKIPMNEPLDASYKVSQGPWGKEEV